MSCRLPALAAVLLLAAPAFAATLDPDTIVAAHNQYRAEVSVPPLSWSPEVAASAQAWAEDMASSGKFRHSGSRYGENIWAGTANAYSLNDMVKSWGDEKADFEYGTRTNSRNGGVVGHYTQIIWRNSTQVGCGLASGGGTDYFVCQYNPPGNYIGQQPY
ncbi:cysteine-rich secretory family protein [Fluviicoccus keumensis]|uniref:Cysteine-rich secretory family protein n=1 Tax=Fluviicoccus keumensis TaxID=1435465 RepID=A0A4Q7ZBA1_9GAMM|nr:CAP domain-containing protein [Fluviicoccus keumensis]RZU47877.1 cysteine-rich secretory family protein [Fluviicoccus keumensis]